MLKGLIQSKNTREQKCLQNQTKKKTKTKTKKEMGTYISIITLNVNRLNAPTKRHRVAK